MERLAGGRKFIIGRKLRDFEKVVNGRSLHWDAGGEGRQRWAEWRMRGIAWRATVTGELVSDDGMVLHPEAQGNDRTDSWRELRILKRVDYGGSSAAAAKEDRR